MKTDLFKAEKNKEEGMARSEGCANKTSAEWSKKAYSELLFFLSGWTGTFLAEDVRRMAEEQGLQEPPSNRAWGGVIRRASKCGLIRFVGYAKTTNPKAHRTPAALWERGAI